ncbi:MAG: hypothetical protein U0414_42790 [Polyangiaceae bacterium]
MRALLFVVAAGLSSVTSTGCEPPAPLKKSGSSTPVSTGTPTRNERCLAAARECIVPLAKADYDRLATCMPDDVIAALGGREQLAGAMALAKNEMEKRGAVIEEATVDAPSDLVTNEGRTFAILPTHLTVKTNDARVRQSGFLVGVSDDEGKTWKFVDGAGGEKVRQLTKLPASVTLPAKSEPEVL